MPTDDFQLGAYLVIFFLLGGVSGFSSGLFGIGGGILSIPFFVLLFPAFGIHGGMEMHVVVATSLALAVPSGALALRKHAHLGNFDADYFRTWMIGLILGILIGLAVSRSVGESFLKIAFMVFLLAMAVYFGLIPERCVLAKKPPAGPVKWLLSAFIGMYCVMIGIAGGSLATPALKLCSLPMARAIAIGSGTSMVISTFGTLSGIWNGWGRSGRPPWAFGYVDTLLFLVMIPSVILVTPLGVEIGSRINP